MSSVSYKPSRLFVSAKQRDFAPTIKETPDLPAIDWSGVGQIAPKPISGTGSGLPVADAIVITWADAEWAAMQHVFCASGKGMAYSARNTGAWSGWKKYSAGLPKDAPSGWSFWGEWRLVEIGGATVMLFKSNTHLDWPGESYLTEMMQMLVREVKPRLVLSIGTAGGAQAADHVGTVRAVSAGTLYEAGKAQSSWPVYKNTWKAAETVLDAPGFSFKSLLFPVPTTESDLRSLCAQFNAYYGTNYSIFELDPDGLSSGDTLPKINDQTGGAEPLLTTSTFVVGTTAGTYAAYACIEMDDAIVGKVCAAAGVAFGFVRNVSDPVQSAALPAEMQGSWGSAIYDAYGIYTSYNGALAAWAMLAGKF
jgi:nucleoside phosphorylase